MFSKGISKGGIEFVERALAYPPERRITARDALDLEWLLPEDEGVAGPETEDRERNLRREKIGHEATTDYEVGGPVLEPMSPSEQLTKAQQANPSSFSGRNRHSPSASPVLRAMDYVLPPQITPHPIPVIHEGMGAMSSYSQMPMSLPAPVK